MHKKIAVTWVTCERLYNSLKIETVLYTERSSIDSLKQFLGVDFQSDGARSLHGRWITTNITAQVDVIIHHRPLALVWLLSSKDKDRNSPIGHFASRDMIILLERK